MNNPHGYWRAPGKLPGREWRRLLLPAIAGACALSACLPGRPAAPVAQVAGGDPQRGPALMRSYGCGACHMIPGVPGATGKVGPPLGGFAERASIAGRLPNTPDSLVRWIRNPQEVEPGNIMPDVGVTEPEARHMAAYLYTLR